MIGTRGADKNHTYHGSHQYSPGGVQKDASPDCDHSGSILGALLGGSSFYESAPKAPWPRNNLDPSTCPAGPNGDRASPLEVARWISGGFRGDAHRPCVLPSSPRFAEVSLELSDLPSGVTFFAKNAIGPRTRTWAEGALEKRLAKTSSFVSNSLPITSCRQKVEGGERFSLRIKSKRTTIFFVDMEIMRTLTASLGKIFGPACLSLCAASGALASDVVLQKVPTTVQVSANSAQSRLGPQATFALINYSVGNTRPARALYVSSGPDLTTANSMIDQQTATSFGFSAEDKSPTAVIDLGKVCTIRHLAAVYSARPGSVDFYIMKSLPGADRDDAANTLKLDEGAFASLKSVGTAVDDGSQGRASVDFPATTGRYVMLRWIPASHADSSFTVAEVSVSGPDQRNLIASSRNFSSNQTTERKTATDSKDVADSKDVSDSKDLPEAVAEGPGDSVPPPPIPPPPPFTFVPQLTPVSE